MPKGQDYVNNPLVKLMYIGGSGTGKTGSLISLLEAGYELFIIDLDRGLDTLISLAKDKDPKLLNKISYASFRDKVKMTAQGTKVNGTARAYADTMAALEKWPDDGSDPATWGSDKVLVIDSLTNLGVAAFRWAKAIDPMNRDPRRWYKNAQDLLDDFLMNLTADEFATNVIVISHIEMTETKDGLIKGYPSAVGKALGPKIGRNFNNLILAETSGQGQKVKRKIKTLPTALIDVKTSAPLRIQAEYDISDGMAKIFASLLGK